MFCVQSSALAAYRRIVTAQLEFGFMRITTMFISFLLLSTMCSAEAFFVAGNEASRTINVKAGDTVSIAGNENKIVIVGQCQSVQVTGNENSVDIKAAFGKLSVLGNKNEVFVNKLEKNRVFNLGNENHISERKASK